MKALLIVLLACLPQLSWAFTAEVLAKQWMAEGIHHNQGLELTLAPWVEDGSFIPLDLVLTGAEPPVSISLLRSEEPDPRIAQITVQEWAEPLRLSTRVRLPQSQSLIVLARDGQGRVWSARQDIEVLASSCMTPMPSARPVNFGQVRVWVDGEHERALRTVLHHPMETGRRPDLAGGFLPRHLPTLFEINSAGNNVLRAEPFEGLSVNPYWRLILPARSHAISIRWVDADGSQFSAELP
ncbi:thiosulfate oxidation carrier complex protein SoxZ [Ectopseudomonas mendocina]|uniref:Thiosulfate oxidation carrier complex protein SoxZ n=1 Tax=Ectopseudomonas mendocina TaxID=300 RepID=A0ABZ2RFA3_ECTME